MLVSDDSSYEMGVFPQHGRLHRAAAYRPGGVRKGAGVEQVLTGGSPMLLLQRLGRLFCLPMAVLP